MSIEITGPRAYEFQDRVCVLLAALAAEDPATELFIEPAGGEDARLVVTKQGARHVVEVQAKREQGDIGAGRLVDWLTHFPSRKAAGSLLENLVSDSSRSVLFVASGRCVDATAPLLVQIGVDRTSLEQGKVKDATEVTVRNALISYAAVVSSADGETDKRRRAHIGTTIQKINALELKSALQRVMIVERMVDADLARSIRDVLQNTHRVVPDQAERISHEIKEIIVREKRTQVNVLPEIAEIIRSNRATDPLRSPTHVDRDEEFSLRAQISKNKVVLITGVPRVGKSFLARSLADSLQRQSFRVQVCSGVEEASRYLLEPVVEFRAALVDDPLGGSHASENAGRELSQLEQLIPRLGTSRRLIVAQAQDRLLEVTREPSVHGLLTAGQTWVVLGLGNPKFLNQVWREAAQSHHVPSALAEQISQELLVRRLDLEPGCLVHLASRHHQVPPGALLDDMVRIARQDAKTLGIAIRAEALAPMMIALAVASTPELRVGETELAFILDSSRSDRPGKSNVNATMTSIGAGADLRADASIVVKPTYEPIPELDASDVDSLEKLELRRMISEVHRSYTFNHPFYRASAESLLDAATSRSRDSAILQLERAIFTLQPSAAKAAATNLDWIYQNLCRFGGGPGVVAVARSGLQSIFPAVRELCFNFLLKRLPTLPQDEQGDVSDWVHKVTWPRLSYVVWSDDEPRIPPATVAGAIEVDPFPERVKRSEVEATLEYLNSDRADKLSTQATARAVQFLAENPDAMTVQMTARLLSLDVALIRTPAAKAWLRLPRADDAEVLGRIFSEVHPAVAQAAYRGVLKSWPSCTKDRRSQLLNGLQKMAASPVTAAALIGDLVLISRKEYGGISTPWQIFEALMPVVLRELPLGASIRDERLYDVVNSAIGNISAEALTAIVDHWLGLVIKIAGSGGVPSDYMLGVSDIIVSGLPSGSAGRLHRIDRLLGLTGTAARIRVVADFVVHWDDLSASEQTKLLDHLVAGALDEVWVQATALTRTNVPADIQAHLLPEDARLDQPARNVIGRMDSKLLSACINVFTGNHPVIYYVGAHGFRNTAWRAIVSEIAEMPEHEMFEAAWEWLMTSDAADGMVQAVISLGPSHADRVAGLILAHKRRTNGHFLPTVWKALFGLPVTEIIKTEWLSRMAEIAPSALDSLQDAAEWIPKDHLDEFLSLLEPDYMLFLLTLTVRDLTAKDESLSTELVAGLVNIAKVLLKDTPPKLRRTYDDLEGLFKAMGVEDEGLMATISDVRSKTLEALHEQTPSRVYPELCSWVGSR
ncbi:MAG: hypothetical protein DI563_09765 [Variovorax paradoxus]|uniref:Novel STAND NTPase 3 domain-containing protein n=1 Tax=Variovorax paradoxus TaxID=34073 RepID=A0A2W5QKM3_VARPD|nr:MAG: hypothetical protein DI563_09765 [Variovorax paradoxus]